MHSILRCPICQTENEFDATSSSLPEVDLLQVEPHSNSTDSLQLNCVFCGHPLDASSAVDIAGDEEGEEREEGDEGDEGEFDEKLELELDDEELPFEEPMEDVELELDSAEDDDLVESKDLPVEGDASSEVEEDKEVEEDELQEEHEFQVDSGEAERSQSDWNSMSSVKPIRKKEVPAWKKVVPPLLGGVAAFPIAILILWYGFGKDLGASGQTVAQYVPWIVPKHLRGSTITAQTSQRNKPKEMADDRYQLEYELQNSRANGKKSAPNDFGKAGSAHKEASGSSTDANTSSNDKERDKQEKLQNKQAQSNAPSAETSDLNGSTSSREELASSEELAVLDLLNVILAIHSDWASTPKSEQLKTVLHYFDVLCELSQGTSKLNFISPPTRNTFSKVSDEVLSHPQFVKSIERVAAGSIPGARKLEVNDYLVCVTRFKLEDITLESEFAVTESPVIINGKATPLRMRGQIFVSTAQASLVFGQLQPDSNQQIVVDVLFTFPSEATKP